MAILSSCTAVAKAPGRRIHFVAPTPVNRPVSVELAHMFRLRDGKIAEQWTVRDDLGMQQLGVI
jgi:hypothetical protein